LLKEVLTGVTTLSSPEAQAIKRLVEHSMKEVMKVLALKTIQEKEHHQQFLEDLAALGKIETSTLTVRKMSLIAALIELSTMEKERVMFAQ